MVLQSSVKRIIKDIGKEFGLNPQESEEHYVMYIEEFVLKTLYEADFDVLRLEALGCISPGLLKTKAYHDALDKVPADVTETRVKVKRLIDHMDFLNTTLRKKRLYR